MPLKLLLSLIISLVLSAGGYFAYQNYKPQEPSLVNTAPIENNEEKLKKELETKNNELKDLSAKVSDIQKQFDDYKKQIATKDAEIATLKKDVTSKNSNIDKLTSSLSKQEACNKMNEYSQLSSDLKFRSQGESGGNGCAPTVALFIVSQNTENAYEYINEWYKNYKATGSQMYKYSPDLCLYDVEKLFSKLKDRRDKFLDYQKKCEAK